MGNPRESERPANFQEVRDPANPGRILFRYDAARDLVEVRHRGKPTLVDLRELQKSGEVGYTDRDR